MFGHKERFSLEESSGQRYGNEWGDWSSRVGQGPCGVCLWKHFRKGCRYFFRFVNFKVGSGINVHFWHDWWCGDGVLKDAFLDFTNSK